MNLYKEYDNNYYIHWGVLIIICIMTIMFVLKDCVRKMSEINDVENFTDAHGKKHHFQLYPSAGSLGGDSYRRPDLIGNINELKKVCEKDPNCKGFSIDGYFKKFISSQDQWINTGKNNGLYVKLPDVRRNSKYPSILYPGTNNL